MAKRLLNSKISKSERVNKLTIPARLLYTWMIPWLDREGRMSGNPRIIKRDVFPLTNYSHATIDRWLDEMAAIKDPVTGEGLVERYEVDGVQYLWMPGFTGEQSGKVARGEGLPIWMQRESPSTIPAPPGRSDTSVPTPPVEPVLGEEDPVMAAMVAAYEKEIGMLTPAVAEWLKDMRAQEFPEGWFEQAITEAVKSNARKPRYIEKVLLNWKEKGINTKPGTNGQPATGRVLDYK